MGSTTASLITRIRDLIPEADPVEWTDPRLLQYLNLEYKEWAAALGRLPGPGWFTMFASFTLPANATTYALTGLVSPSSVGNFAAMKVVTYIPESGDEMLVPTVSPGQEFQLRLAVGQGPVGQEAPRGRWLTRPAGVPTLNFGAPANVDRSLRAMFRYEPPALTNAALETVQTDPRHDDVLVMGSALRAFLNVGETDPVVKEQYELLRIRFLDEERNAAGEFESETTKVVVGPAMFGDERY